MNRERLHAPERSVRTADAFLIRQRRPRYNPNGHGLPDPNVDLGAYLHELRKRTRAAVERFATADARIRELHAMHTAGMGGDEMAGHISFGKDGELASLASTRASAALRIGVYTNVIQAEDTIARMLDAGSLTA